MNALRDLISNDLPLVIGLFAFLVLQTLAFRWIFKKIQTAPVGGADDLADAEETGTLSDAVLQSRVGTPRARRLQPARPAASELNLPELNTATPTPSEVGFPADSLAMAGESAFAKKPETAKPAAATLPDIIRPATSLAAAKPAEPKGATVLPPLASELPQPAETDPRKPQPPAGSLVSNVSITETKGLGTTALPPLAVATGPLPGAAAPAKKETPPEKPLGPVPAVLPPIAFAPVPEPVKPVIAPVEPAKVEPVAAKPVDPLPAPPADLNDVKKQNTPPPPETPQEAATGLILIPDAPAAVKDPAPPEKAVESKADLPSTPAEPAAPAESETPTAATPATEPAPAAPAESTSFFSKMMGSRPRIFMPPAAAKSEPESAAKVPSSPASAEAVPETAALADGTPPVAETPVSAKSETPDPAKSETPVVPPVSAPVGSLTVHVEKPAPEPAKPAAKATTPAKPEPAPAKPEPAAAAKPATPPVPAGKPGGKSPAATPDLPAEDGTPAAPLVPAPAPVSAKPTEPPAPAPVKPTASLVPLVPSTPANAIPPVPAANPTAVSVTTPQRTMPQDTTTAVPANARAAAQLTLGFEITSLQLTPFFKLGAVQLRPLSNVVSLHLIASSAADNPLAAGISFQIVTVELNEAAHLKSILLKPLPQAQPATVPSQKLAVDNVQITQAGENAPISVTTSESTSTAVQLLADFTIAGMDFTPSFEIGSLRLEPTSNSVLLRLAPSQRPAALDLPPSFEVANVQLGNDAQLSGVRLTPGGARA